MSTFYLDVIAKDPRFNCKNIVSDLDLLEPITRKAVISIVEQARLRGVDLWVFETYRSRERQLHLFQQGVSQLKEVGVHHFGLACDLVKIVGSGLSWNGDYSFLGELAAKNGLVWGGNWGDPGSTPAFVDAVHVQRCSVGHQEKLFSLLWYPDASYRPEWQPPSRET